MTNIFMASLGCAKNLVDAEIMLGETLGGEYALVVDPGQADVIVVNTCGFIEEARDEARRVIAEFLGIKKTARRPVRVVATGCWSQREPEKVLEEFPGLDAVWGLDAPSNLTEKLAALGPRPDVGCVGGGLLPRQGARLVTTLPSFAYLRLSDGCDNRCAYCAIPLIRGPLRSREPGDILDEARMLEQQGARELVLISQDTTAYAADAHVHGRNLASLLEALLGAVSVPRLRLLYAHPAHLTDEVADLLAGEERFCRYLDLPVQHTSDAVLAAMGRGYGSERILEIIDRLGPDFTLRTTILAGFPGESEADFLHALDFVRAGHFRQLGAFAYSPEPGTRAFDSPGRVPRDEAEKRRDAILAAQAEHAFRWLDSRIGKDEEILVDSRADREWLIGRSRHEAPDADGVVYVRSTKARAGDMVMACVAGRDGYDLFAETRRDGRKHRRGRK